jgi:NADH dehydrogenase (ubiquinone) 1 alpha subcomplex subunit 6
MDSRVLQKENKIDVAMPLGTATASSAGAQVVQASSRNKTLQFYREVARCFPSIINQYKLGELTTLAELRRTLSEMIRKNAGVKEEGARDVLIYKGREELEMILMNHKQRHHLVRDYVKNPAMDRVEKVRVGSAFLEKFYKGA